MIAPLEGRPSRYLDLESDADGAGLSEPDLHLAAHAEEIVIWSIRVQNGSRSAMASTP
jgi:hypothetical protein